MKKITSLLFLILFIFSINGITQTILTLQPGPNTGKDVLAHELSTQRNVNFGNNDQFSAHAGTNNGTYFIVRSYMEFDFSSIPSGMKVDSAFLSLYAFDQTHGFAKHRNSSGPNGAWLRRVTTSWSESTLTWNNQPSVTTINQVALAPSINQTQNYLNINVKPIIQDIFQNPINNGFQIILQDENYYRTLNFYSSDAQDSLKRPKLVVYYSPISTSLDDVSDTESKFNIFPNPTNGIFQIEFDNHPNLNLSIIDLAGKEVGTFSNYRNLEQINLIDLTEGIYFIKATNGNYTATKKLIIKD